MYNLRITTYNTCTGLKPNIDIDKIIWHVNLKDINSGVLQIKYFLRKLQRASQEVSEVA